MKWVREIPCITTGALAVASVLAVLLAAKAVFFGSDIYALAASIQDDSFYYIIPAFNFSHGSGFSFGGVPAYGFQPGYELLLAVIGLAADSVASLLRYSLFANAVLFAATGVVVMMTVVRACAIYAGTGRQGYVCAAIALLVYFSNTWNYLNSTTGKENPFAALLLMLCIHMVLRAEAVRRPGYAAAVGVLAGILVITRPVPSTLLYVLVFMWASRPAYKAFLAGLLIAPVAWLFFAKTYFGVFVPYSAAIKSAAPSLPFEPAMIGQAWEYLLTAVRFGVFGPSAVDVPQPDWHSAGRAAALATILHVVLSIAVVACVATIARLNGDRRRALAIIPMAIGAFALGSLLMGLAMALKRPHEMYYASWYFYDAPAILSLAIGVGLYLLSSGVRRMAGPGPSGAFALLVVISVAVVHLNALRRYSTFQPYTAATLAQGVGNRWQNTVIAAGLWLRENQPDWRNKTTAAFSAGALGLVLDDRVINLDGLSNNDAATTLLAGQTIQDYLMKARPDYFVEVGTMSPVDAALTLRPLHVFPFPSMSGMRISAFQYSEGPINESTERR